MTQDQLQHYYSLRDKIMTLPDDVIPRMVPVVLVVRT
jgi:hypothetical protein